jgi:hypothetical protein
VLPCLAVATLGLVSCSNGGAPAGDAKREPPSAPASQPAPAPISAEPSSTCPPSLVVAQTIAAGVAGWEPFEDDTPIQLMSVGVFDGHPRERASLVPDSDTTSAGRRVAVWKLPENGTRRYWLACYYDRSRIAVTRILAGDIARVEVTRDPQVTIGGQPEVTGIAFK